MAWVSADQLGGDPVQRSEDSSTRGACYWVYGRYSKRILETLGASCVWEYLFHNQTVSMFLNKLLQRIYLIEIIFTVHNFDL